MSDFDAVSSVLLTTAMAGTREAYKAGAREYAKATCDYKGFSGLREELDSFASSVVNDGPILDLGSGGGRDSYFLAGLGKRVVSGDLCLELLDDARRRWTCINISQICLNMVSLPFADNSFAAVWACGSLLHLPSAYIHHGLSEIYRVLRSDGLIAINMQTGSEEGWRTGGTLEGKRWFTYVDSDAFSKSVVTAGFTDVDYRQVGRPGWIVVTGRKL